MRSKIKRFPEVVEARIDRKMGRAFLRAEATFDQYRALEHAVEEAGGAIQMFHPRYLVPQAHFASLGIPERDPDRLDRLEAALGAIPGVRSAIIDRERWFKNEKGLDVGGVVVYADTNPRLIRSMSQAATELGFVFEPKDHGASADDHDEWSEMNHAFAGLCLLFLTAFGLLQVAMRRPPAFARYGPVVVWLVLFVFLFIRADRGAWPLGGLSWWESFGDWDTAQHRLGVSMILVIALGDLARIRRGWTINPVFSRWGMLAVGVVGSGLLYTHLHSTLDPAHYAMVRRMNAQHIAMATSALLFSVSKFAWDTWQVPKRGGEYAWLLFLGILGVILTLYVE